MGCLPKLCTIVKFSYRSDTAQLHDEIVCKEEDDGVKKYDWEDICAKTSNFSCVIGSGGFSTVYLGQSAAVKMIPAGSGHLKRILKNELDVLLRLNHHNIVKLLGYFNDDDDDYEGANALVLEYVPNGNLQDHLHGNFPAISWRRRMGVAYQLAQALEYLHDKCAPQIVHGDIKPSNVLLDEQLNCKLCDFGSAKMGFSSMVKPNSRGMRQVMMGSPGYTDPHYLRTGLPSKKNDVYSYGVIVLELVTGLEAFCEEEGRLLTSTMGPELKRVVEWDDEKVAKMVDPKLGGGFDVKEARAMLSIAALCIDQSPVVRPTAAGIVDRIKENVPSISLIDSFSKTLKNEC